MRYTLLWPSMTLTEYKALSTDHRYIVWLSKAVRIAAYKNLLFEYTLYQVEGFYVQIRSLRYFKSTDKWSAFSHESYLKPYLKKINIGEIRNHGLKQQQLS
jgi:hypothetical protein